MKFIKSINKCYFYSLHFERGVFTNSESEEIINDTYNSIIDNRFTFRIEDNDFIRNIRFEILNHKMFHNILLHFVRFRTICERVLIDKFYNN